MTVARHERMTDADKARKLARQRARRETAPTIHSRLRTVIGDEDYLRLYDKLLTQQNGVCGICSKPPGVRRFHMDYDHRTGEVRGLLCFSCNSKLGFVEKLIIQIVRYLK